MVMFVMCTYSRPSDFGMFGMGKRGDLAYRSTLSLTL